MTAHFYQRGAARVGEPVGFELVERTTAEEFSVKAAEPRAFAS